MQFYWSLAFNDGTAAKVVEVARLSGKMAPDLQATLQREWFGRLLKILFQQAFVALSANRTGWSFGMRIKESDTDFISTLEFRRIPAHANAAEAILWMNFAPWPLAKGVRRNKTYQTIQTFASTNKSVEN